MAIIRVLPRKNLGSGNRIVQTFTNGTVIKWGCPKSPASGGQNLIEAMTWHEIKGRRNVRDVVMPVLSAAEDGTWLMMPEANVSGTWSSKEREALRQRVARLGLETSDMHDGNLAYNAAGKLVMIDYGYRMADFGRKRKKCDGCEWARLKDYKDAWHTDEDTCVYCWNPIAEGDIKRPYNYVPDTYFHARCY